MGSARAGRERAGKAGRDEGWDGVEVGQAGMRARRGQGCRKKGGPQKMWVVEVPRKAGSDAGRDLGWK